MEKILLKEEASMNYPVKQLILKRIISLKKSPFVRPHLPGFLQASTVTVFNMVIDRSELDSFTSLQSCYDYFLVASNSGTVKADEFIKLKTKLVTRNYDFIMDSGANKDLAEGYLSVLAVSYSGKIKMRSQNVLPEDASVLDRLLFKGRLLCCGCKDENGMNAINTKEGFRAYRQAAGLGAPEALYAMGVFYHHGIECEKDSQKAKSYLEAAANSSSSARWSCSAINFALKEQIALEIK